MYALFMHLAIIPRPTRVLVCSQLGGPGVSPVELKFNCLLRGPLDVVLQPQEAAPDTPAYTNT